MLAPIATSVLEQSDVFRKRRRLEGIGVLLSPRGKFGAARIRFSQLVFGQRQDSSGGIRSAAWLLCFAAAALGSDRARDARASWTSRSMKNPAAFSGGSSRGNRQGPGIAAAAERLILVREQSQGEVGSGEHRGRVDPGGPAIPARDARRGVKALAHRGAGFGQGSGLDCRLEDLERADRPDRELDRALDPAGACSGRRRGSTAGSSRPAPRSESSTRGRPSRAARAAVLGRVSSR